MENQFFKNCVAWKKAEMTQYQKISRSGGRYGDKIYYKFSVFPSQDVTSQRTLATLLAQNYKGQCSYLQLVDEHQAIHYLFVMGKSQLTPLKPKTIPRLELTAAVCSVKISQQLRWELEFHIDREYFWTDRKLVLGSISNDSR